MLDDMFHKTGDVEHFYHVGQHKIFIKSIVSEVLLIRRSDFTSAGH